MLPELIQGGIHHDLHTYLVYTVVVVEQHRSTSSVLYKQLKFHSVLHTDFM